ncbi:MAG TPA: hypothetical protein VMW42_00275 [Desulfatiglandales bacterium]|nr:hypothetical protein [Desulfatiglandales bacterium]
MDFEVLSRREIKDFHTSKRHIVISVMAPGDSDGHAKMPNNKNRMDILFMIFHDWNGRDMRMMKKSNASMLENFVFFNREMAKQIVEFVRSFADLELIVCQCEAGISRSAGIAAALAKCINGDDTYYFKHFLPNTLVYSLIMKEWNKR